MVYLSRMPIDSNYVESVLNDIEVAEAGIAAAGGCEKYIEAMKAAGDPHPARRNHGPRDERLARIEDAIRDLNHTLIAVNSESPPDRPPPTPRPTSAHEVLIGQYEAERFREAEDELNEALLRGNTKGR